MTDSRHIPHNSSTSTSYNTPLLLLIHNPHTACVLDTTEHAVHIVVSVDERQCRPTGEVDLVKRDKLGALYDLIPEPGDEDDGQGNVARDKVLGRKLADERREAVENDDKAEYHNTDVGDIGLAEGAEREVPAVDA